MSKPAWECAHANFVLGMLNGKSESASSGRDPIEESELHLLYTRSMQTSFLCRADGDADVSTREQLNTNELGLGRVHALTLMDTSPACGVWRVVGSPQ